DDPDIRDALTVTLRYEGYEVEGVGNGEEAMRQMRGGSLPDLILLDLMMPVMDGWQFRREQQRDPLLADIPVVVVTADGNAQPRAAAAGIHDYLRKPIDLEELLQIIKRHGLRSA